MNLPIMAPGAELMDAGVGLLLGVYGVIFGVSLIFGIVSYIFRGIGLYQIAKRRRIHHPWLSWIPVGDQWILGSVADQYQYLFSISSKRAESFSNLTFTYSNFEFHSSSLPSIMAVLGSLK